MGGTILGRAAMAKTDLRGLKPGTRLVSLQHNHIESKIFPADQGLSRFLCPLQIPGVAWFPGELDFFCTHVKDFSTGQFVFFFIFRRIFKYFKIHLLPVFPVDSQ
ncbi:hypothetical protein [Desulfolutivibrio sulfoxidireducens]|uniref:hypothetical protein n=1 Tax=Desulfolutivibrio sulfoxidireducens TaxID=2773299 RepID=UPI00159DE1C0|nr:hypothetical protein [Desulfolutivibrio sulfoxidireducens]QLA16120.1 hypothetical protein GD605_08265 [Desulfolutivibrio sulfoxidireducens]